MTTPVCTTCGDTHSMWLHTGSRDTRKVPCTFCPVPCSSCRGHLSPYCRHTPCACECHTPKRSYSMALNTDPNTPLTPIEDELLGLIVEECAEVIQAVSKIRRFGRFGRARPDDPKWGDGNLAALWRELADISVVVELMNRAGFTDAKALEARKRDKLRTIRAHLGPAKVLIQEEDR